MIEVVENNVVKLWLEDEIIHFLYKKHCIVSLDVAKEIVGMRLAYQKGKTYKCITFLSSINAITPEAKEFLAKEGAQGISKAALIITSPFTKIMGNLFITINKPLVPTKLFSNKEQGMKWLIKEQ